MHRDRAVPALLSASALLLSLAALPHPAAAQIPADEDLVIRTFYLENTEVNDTMTLLRSLLDAKKLATNERLGSIVLRDTAAKVALAERLIEAQEKPRAEVELTLELLAAEPETLRALARDLGGDGTAGLPSRLSAAQLARLESAPGVRTLAAPRLSALDGKRARLTLGEAVPIPRAAAGGQTGEEEQEPGAVPVSYQEIGLEVAVRPQVHPRSGEVTLELDLGLSGLLRGASLRPLPTVARRSVAAQIRLADGETCLLRGMMSIVEGGASGFAALPLLAADPAEGRRELLLALTPRIVRRPEITDADRRPLPVGAALGSAER